MEEKIRKERKRKRKIRKMKRRKRKKVRKRGKEMNRLFQTDNSLHEGSKMK